MYEAARALEAVQILREQYEMQQRAIQRYGLEAGFNKYPGVYRAFVYDNKDPDKRGRVRIYCPDVGHIESSPPSKWAECSFAGADANRGSLHTPEIGDAVFINFYHGDPSWPWCYWGGWYAKDELPAEFAYSGDGTPQRGGWITRGGHRTVWSDEKDSESLTIAWHKPDPTDEAVTSLPTKEGQKTASADRSRGQTSTFEFLKDGSINITNANGTHVQLDATGKKIEILDKDNTNTVTLDSNGIKLSNSAGSALELKGSDCIITVTGTFTVNAASVKLNSPTTQLDSAGTFSALNGEPVVSQFNAHVHPTAVGPSGPPVVPLVAVTSLSVKL